MTQPTCKLDPFDLWCKLRGRGVSMSQDAATRLVALIDTKGYAIFRGFKIKKEGKNRCRIYLHKS